MTQKLRVSFSFFLHNLIESLSILSFFASNEVKAEEEVGVNGFRLLLLGDINKTIGPRKSLTCRNTWMCMDQNSLVTFISSKHLCHKILFGNRKHHPCHKNRFNSCFSRLRNGNYLFQEVLLATERWPSERFLMRNASSFPCPFHAVVNKVWHSYSLMFF